jgi:hypothetical protein
MAGPIGALSSSPRALGGPSGGAAKRKAPSPEEGTKRMFTSKYTGVVSSLRLDFLYFYPWL